MLTLDPRPDLVGGAHPEDAIVALEDGNENVRRVLFRRPAALGGLLRWARLRHHRRGNEEKPQQTRGRCRNASQ
jgi:hypothetical protein